MPMPTMNGPVATSRFTCSCVKIVFWIDVAPRPPYSFGQVMPAQPPS